MSDWEVCGTRQSAVLALPPPSRSVCCALDPGFNAVRPAAVAASSASPRPTLTGNKAVEGCGPSRVGAVALLVAGVEWETL